MSELPPDDVPFRREERYPVEWKVRVQTKEFDEVHTMKTVNLSRSGAFICTTQMIKAGTLLQLTFMVPGEDEVVAFADVVRLVEEGEANQRSVEQGLGVAFMNPRKGVRELLDRIVDSGTRAPVDELINDTAPTWSEIEQGDGDDEISFTQRDEQSAQLLSRGRAHFQLGEHAEAHELASNLLEINGADADYKLLFHLASGALLAAGDDVAQAKAHWEAAVQIDARCVVAIKALRESEEAAAAPPAKKGIVGKLMGAFRGGDK